MPQGSTSAAACPVAAAGAPRLPIERVFVVRLAAAGEPCRGLVEHVASGERMNFASLRELIAALRREPLIRPGAAPAAPAADPEGGW